MLNLGVVQQDATIYIPIPTRTAAGAAVTGNTLADGDFEFHKDGSTTASTIDAAATTPSTDFATTTGRNQLAVDLSADSDFTEGSFWQVWLSKSIDSTTIEECVATFTIETDHQKAVRLLQESAYPTDGIISTTTGNTTGRINLTDVVDAQTADADLVGSKWLVRDITNDQTVEVTATSVQSARLFNVETSAAGDAMDFTVAAGDYVLFAGFANVARIMSIEDGTGLTEAGGDGDHLTAVSLASLDEAALQQIVDDLENGGRLDLLIDAIKAKTDSLTFTNAGEVDANTVSINDVTITGDGSATPFDV